MVKGSSGNKLLNRVLEFVAGRVLGLLGHLLPNLLLHFFRYYFDLLVAFFCCRDFDLLLRRRSKEGQKKVPTTEEGQTQVKRISKERQKKVRQQIPQKANGTSGNEFQNTVQQFVAGPSFDLLLTFFEPSAVVGPLAFF